MQVFTEDMLPKWREPWARLPRVVCGKGHLLEVPGAPWGGLITPGEVGENKEFYVSCNLQDYEMFPSVIFLKLKLRLLRFT